MNFESSSMKFQDFEFTQHTQQLPISSIHYILILTYLQTKGYFEHKNIKAVDIDKQNANFTDLCIESY